jgi:citrate synthase
MINVDSIVNMLSRGMHQPALLSARDAARLLEVRLATLYAYVSRGLLRSVPDARKGRRLYFRDDLERLRMRRQASGGHGAAAAGALRWGEPVLDSALTEITPTGPRYRGLDALELAERGASLECVAELLWTGTLPARAAWPPPPEATPVLARLARALPRHARPLESLAFALPALAARDSSRHGASLAAQLERGRRLLRGLAAALALPGHPERLAAALGADTVAESVLLALGQPPRRNQARAVDRALVLSADHELNPSAFAARVAASTGADLYASSAAALATLSGPLHGGSCDRVEGMLAEAGSASRARSSLDERLRRGDSVPGFGHPLYPAGDPRGRLLLRTAQSLGAGPRELQTLVALVEAMGDRGREGPTLDAGLVALAAALGLPGGSAVGLFAVGRACGWIAHALEQQSAGFVLRPRARYVGPRP